MNAPPLYDRDTLPAGHWNNYRKKTLTRAIRIQGPFQVQTSEGLMACEDGYLALDNKNNPYPIDREVFETTYEEIEVEADIQGPPMNLGGCV